MHPTLSVSLSIMTVLACVQGLRLLAYIIFGTTEEKNDINLNQNER